MPTNPRDGWYPRCKHRSTDRYPSGHFARAVNVGRAVAFLPMSTRGVRPDARFVHGRYDCLGVTVVEFVRESIVAPRVYP